MKKLLMLIVMLVMAVAVMAQSANKISYQAVVRDANNRLVTKTEVQVKVTIGGYEETFTVNTNANGLVSFQIPNANVTDFNNINWSTATIKTEVTIGSEPAVVNEVPVTAVPYALYASDVNPNGAAVQAIYTKMQADSIALADQVNTLNTSLTEKIKGDSVALADQVNTLNTTLTEKIKGDSVALAGNINANKQAIIDTAANIRAALPREMKVKIMAAAAQTSFDLGTEPNTTNAYVKMFINGILVGDNEDGVITISGSTATYVPAQNGNYELKADDRIVFYFFK